MTMIVPAGNKNIDWSPKEAVLTKTASAGAEVQEEVNPLYEAAKKYAESTKVCEKCKKPGALCECASAAAPEAACKADEVAVVEVEDGAPAIDGAPAVEGEKATIEVAVEKIEEGVAELKDAANIPAEAAGVEVGEAGESKSLDIPGKEVQDSEIIVKSEPADACACAAAKTAASEVAKSDAASSDAKSDKKEDIKTAASEVAKSDVAASDDKAASSDAKSDKKAEIKIELEKSANVEEKFCKLSHITPENRKKVVNYWVNMLNYPKDYVALMVKDSEK